MVTAQIAVAAARGILLSCDRSKLAEFGGPVMLNRFWTYSLLKRMNFVKRMVTTAKSKYAVAEFQHLKEEFLQDAVTTVEMEEIPSELNSKLGSDRDKDRAIQHMDHGRTGFKASGCCRSK